MGEGGAGIYGDKGHEIDNACEESVIVVVSIGLSVSEPCRQVGVDRVIIASKSLGNVIGSTVSQKDKRCGLETQLSSLFSHTYTPLDTYNTSCYDPDPVQYTCRMVSEAMLSMYMEQHQLL